MTTQPRTPVRRVVTGHDASGRACLRFDEHLAAGKIPRGDAEFTLVWTTSTVPADNNDDTDGATRPAGLTLPGGSVIRVVDLAPHDVSPMHRSSSIDYGIVLSGRLVLALEGGDETTLSPGDIVVQRGTNHLWRNPSATEWCRIVFVLIEASAATVNGVALQDIHP